MEVNCTEPSPSVSVPCRILFLQILAKWVKISQFSSNINFAKTQKEEMYLKKLLEQTLVVISRKYRRLGVEKKLGKAGIRKDISHGPNIIKLFMAVIYKCS